jgi:hypothetical protein
VYWLKKIIPVLLTKSMCFCFKNLVAAVLIPILHNFATPRVKTLPKQR